MNDLVPDARVVCTYEDSQSMHTAIRAGAGIGLMPYAFAEPDPHLARLPSVRPGFGYDIWCFTHPDVNPTGRVRSFLTYAGRYFDARRDLHKGYNSDTARSRPGSDSSSASSRAR
ncbi:MAG: DNA-binding transcriptional LysR family regulator [Kiritimatiellia bacterium]|jgi:DNA-binding transcriptional LysR family regulator